MSDLMTKQSGVKLFYQQGYNPMFGRMRMIWPDGRSQWVSDSNAMFGRLWNVPCWTRFTEYMDDEFYGKNKTQKDAIQAMRSYDKSNGWPAAWYLGEI